MFLINISSNYRQKFFIGSALNLLSELGDMYISDVFRTKDRQGSDSEFMNCCLQLTNSTKAISLEDLISQTKAIEVQLGRTPNDKQLGKMPIDIDVLAHKKTEEDVWQFLDKRLPLTKDVIWGLSDLQMDFSHVGTVLTKSELPKPEEWWG